MKKLESEVFAYLQERGWDKLRPSDIAKSISIEAAELLEVFQWTSMSLEETKADEKVMEELKKELADVFIYALDMVVLLGLDTEEIVMSKLNAVKDKYPAETMREDARAGTGSGNNSEYLRIKQNHRKSCS